jgi:hypothetical protein
MNVLRAVLTVIGFALLVGAAVFASAGCGLGVTLRLALPGLLLIGAALFERWRYKRLASGRPGTTIPRPASAVTLAADAPAPPGLPLRYLTVMSPVIPAQSWSAQRMS